MVVKHITGDLLSCVSTTMTKIKKGLAPQFSHTRVVFSWSFHPTPSHMAGDLWTIDWPLQEWHFVTAKTGVWQWYSLSGTRWKAEGRNAGGSVIAEKCFVVWLYMKSWSFWALWEHLWELMHGSLVRWDCIPWALWSGAPQWPGAGRCFLCGTWSLLTPPAPQSPRQCVSSEALSAWYFP